MRIGKSELKQLIKEEMGMLERMPGPDDDWISGEASTMVGALERSLTDALEDYKEGRYEDVAAELKEIAFEIEQMSKDFVVDPQKGVSLPGAQQSLAGYEDVHPTKIEEDATGTYWTPENAHEGVEEMEGHISNIMGALADLAAAIDKTNPKIAAANILRKHNV